MIDNLDMQTLICDDVFEKIFPGRVISDDDPEFAQLYDDVSDSILDLLRAHQVITKIGVYK
tara:strand:+ start:338 stop:520 length:183 start_codon:yes stop_codon:yes gene_type:complete